MRQQPSSSINAAARSITCQSKPTLRCARAVRTKRNLNKSTTRQHAVDRSAAAQTSSSTDLLGWMQQNGCSVSGVQLVYQTQPDGGICRELRASKDLSPGDVLMCVPLACTVHYIDSQHTQPLQQNDSSNSQDGSRRAALQRLQCNVPAASDSGRGAWQFKVALEVLYHYYQGTSSPLYPYIQTLPGVHPGIAGPQVAMLYPEAQVQELQYAPLIADAGSQAYWWKRYSNEVLAKLPGTVDDPFGGQLVTQEKLGWALSIAMSRAFGFKRLGGWALVPLVDMANHALTSNAEIRYDADAQTVRMIANKQVAAGSPIFLRYGSHDNTNLLLSYGFVLQDNPADTLACQLDMDVLLAAIYQFVGGELPPTGRAVDGLKQWQKTKLQQLGLLDSSSNTNNSSSSSSSAGATDNTSSSSSSSSTQHTPVMVHIGGDPPVSAALLAAVRILLASDRAMVKGKLLEELGDWHQPLSAAHEALVMKALVGFVTVLYKSFPTSIQADKALLAQLQQGGSATDDVAVAAGGGDGSSNVTDVLSVERLQTAVQFRLGLKLLLERSTKALIVRLKELLQ